MERYLILHLTTLLVINTVPALESAAISISFSDNNFKAFASALNSRTHIARNILLKGFDIRNSTSPNKRRELVNPLGFVDDIFEEVEELYSENNKVVREEAILKLTNMKEDFEEKTKALHAEYKDMAGRIKAVCSSIQTHITKFFQIKNLHIKTLLGTLDTLDPLNNICKSLPQSIKNFIRSKLQPASSPSHRSLNKFMDSSTDENIVKLLIKSPDYSSSVSPDRDIINIKNGVESAKSTVEQKLSLLKDNIASLKQQRSKDVATKDTSQMRQSRKGNFASVTIEDLETLNNDFSNLLSSLTELSEVLPVHDENTKKLKDLKNDFEKKFKYALINLSSNYKTVVDRLKDDLLVAIEKLNERANLLLNPSDETKKAIHEAIRQYTATDEQAEKLIREVGGYLARYMQRLAAQIQNMLSSSKFDEFDIKPFNWLLARESMKYAVSEAHNFSEEPDKFTSEININGIEITIAQKPSNAEMKYVIPTAKCKVFGAYVLPQLPQLSFGQLDVISGLDDRPEHFISRVYAPFTTQRLDIFKSPYKSKVTVSPAALKFMKKNNNKNPEEIACDIGIFKSGKADIVLSLVDGTSKPIDILI